MTHGGARSRRLAALVAAALAVSAHPADAETIAFTGVNVVSTADGSVLPSRTVLVENGQIALLGEVATTIIPPGARIIEARGRFLMPGLIDAHVHLRPGDADAYLRSGVTLVRDMAATPLALGVRESWSSRAVAPRVITGTPLFDSAATAVPDFAVVVPDVATARQLVDTWADSGAAFIKVYDRLDAGVYRAIADQADQRGLPLSGHVPFSIDISEATGRQKSIEHLSGYSRTVNFNGRDRSRFQELAAMTAMSGTWNCPTLHVIAHLNRGLPADTLNTLLENRRAFVAALAEASAKLLIGTDAGWLVPAGTSYHEELAEFERAGLSRAEIISIATMRAAEFMGLDAEVGSIAPGMRADLLLLESNPLEDLTALRRPLLVVIGGRLVDYRRTRPARR